MDGLELRQTLMEALAAGLKALAEERKTANGHYHAELVGRMDATRNILDFLVNAQVESCPGAEKKGCEECGGECQGHPDSGGPEEKPKKKAKKGKA